MTYTQRGPFNNGAAPGLDATFFNGLETWILGVDQPTVTTVNGGTSGTASLYQQFTGTVKRVLVFMNNFRTGGSNQNISIPTPFVSSIFVLASNVDTFSLMTGGGGGTAITLHVITALASGGGTDTSVTSMGSNSMAWGGACDTVQFASGAGSAHTGLIIIDGI